MAIEPIFCDYQGNQITYTELCRDIIGVAPRANVNSLMAVPVNYRAKFKPVRKSAPNYVRNPDFYKSDNGLCGIEIPQLIRFSDIRTQKWKHIAPRSGMGENEPAMLSDFYFHGRYDKTARPFVSTSPVKSLIYDKVSQSSQGLTVPVTTISTDANAGELKISDIPWLQNLYVAVSLVPAGYDPTEYTTQTSFEKLNNDIMGVHFSGNAIKDLPPGSYHLWYYLTDAYKDYGTGSRVANNYAIDWDNGYSNPISLSIIQAAPISVRILRYSNTHPADLQEFPSDYSTPIDCYNTLWFECEFTNHLDSHISTSRQNIYLEVDGFWFPPTSKQEPTLSTGSDVIIIPPKSTAIYTMTGHFSRIGNTDHIPPSPQDDYNEWASYTIKYALGADTPITIGGTGVFRIKPST